MAHMTDFFPPLILIQFLGKLDIIWFSAYIPTAKVHNHSWAYGLVFYDLLTFIYVKYTMV